MDDAARTLKAIKRVPNHSVDAHRVARCNMALDGVFPKSTERRFWGRRPNYPPWTATLPFHRCQWSALTMKPEEQTEDEIILSFAVSDDALEFAASPNFSLGNCTDARICPVDG